MLQTDHTAGRERLALLFAALFPTLGTFLYFVTLTGSRWTAPVYAACKVIQFSFPLLWIAVVERARPNLFRRPRRAGLWFGLFSGLGLAVTPFALKGLLLARQELAGLPAAVVQKTASFGIDTPAKYFALALFYSLLHSLLEEYYWRWFLFGRLRRRLPVGTAVVLSSLAFTAHHVLVVGQFLGGYGAATWLAALTITGAGMLWAWSYHRSNSLFGAWISHALADAGLMWIGYQIWWGAVGV